MATKTVGFSVEGQFITDFARQRVIEGCWRHAMTVLECLEGTTHEHRTQVLKAEKRFVGVNTFELEDEDSKRDGVADYLETLNYQYGGLLHFSGPGSFWKPYAYVDGYGWHDMDGTSRKVKWRTRPSGWPFDLVMDRDSISGERFPICGRAMHYADDWTQDAGLCLKVPGAPTGEAIVLWERVDDPPMFAAEMGASDKPQEVLDAWIKAGRPLERRGHSQEYPNDKGPRSGLFAVSKKKKAKEPEPEEEPAPEYSEPPESLTDMEDIAKRVSGWLDRQGRFYPCDEAAHRMMAEHICETVLDEHETRDAEKYLDKKGWAKRTLGAGGHWFWDADRLTKRQKDVIMSWYAIRGEKIPVTLKYRFEDI